MESSIPRRTPQTVFVIKSPYKFGVLFGLGFITAFVIPIAVAIGIFIVAGIGMTSDLGKREAAPMFSPTLKSVPENR